MRHVERDVRAEATELLLASFHWTDGHADFAKSLRDARFLAVVGEALASPFAASDVTAVVGLEARGFVVAALVARELSVGLLLARKPGNVHPGAEREVAATRDRRGRLVELEISRQAVRPGDRLLLADDWIETGSQARTVASLVHRLEAHLVGVTVLVDDTTDLVRRHLTVVGLVRSADCRPMTEGTVASDELDEFVIPPMPTRRRSLLAGAQYLEEGVAVLKAT